MHTQTGAPRPDEGCRRGEVSFQAAFVSSGPALSPVAEQDSTTCEPRRRRGGAGGGEVGGVLKEPRKTTPADESRAAAD